MAGRAKFVFFCLNYVVLLSFVNSELTNMLDEDVLTTKAYVFWPNATIPFYIDSDHFDHEQSIAILTALSLFAFKTCLKFAPVMARPQGTEHVLILENPTGVRKCSISTEAHSIEEPHRVTLGYDCLKPPEIDMMLMKALGFPFEHNRAVRDLYIEVQPENVEPGYLELFTRDLRLPMELRAIAYDPNSVMHFGEREFSKNGHRTIIFKNRNLRQERFGLSPLDLRRIDVVYGPECRKRDRQEKIDLCQNYPGVARKKRDVTSPPRSLRVNPDITPPPNTTEQTNVTANNEENAADEANQFANAVVKELGIEKEVQEIVEQVNKVGAVLLAKTKDKICSNNTKNALRTIMATANPGTRKVVDIIGDIALYANNLVYKATQNLTEFCSEASSIYNYQRSSCPFFDKDRCPKYYKSTKSGPVKYSTQHRPLIHQSTKPQYTHNRNIHVHWLRGGNETDPGNETVVGDETTPLPPSPDVEKPEANSTSEDQKPDLRSGHTRLPSHNHHFAPNYRSNDSEAKGNERKKREIPKETVIVKTSPKKDAKSEKLKKLKKVESKIQSAKRRFESQRFRAKKETQKGDYERGQKEREWDNSCVSAEKHSYKGKHRTPDHRSVKVTDKKRKQSESQQQFSEKIREKKSKQSESQQQSAEKILEKKRKQSESEQQSAKKMPRFHREEPYQMRYREDTESSVEKTRFKKRPRPMESKTSIEDGGRESRISSEKEYLNDHLGDTRDKHSYEKYDQNDRNREQSKLNSGKRYKNDRDREIGNRPSSYLYSNDQNYHVREPVSKMSNRNDYKSYHRETASRISSEKDNRNEHDRGTVIKMSNKKEYGNDRDREKGSKMTFKKEYKNVRDRGTGSKLSDINYQNDHVGGKVRNSDEKEQSEGKEEAGTKVSDDEGQEEVEKPKVSEEDLKSYKVDSQEQQAEPTKKLRLVETASKPVTTTHRAPSPTHSERAQSMMLPRVLDLSKKNREFYEERKWPDGVARYILVDPGNVDMADVRRRLEEVNQILKKRTCARLEELTEEEADNYEDFLVLDNSPDYVTGRVGGRQNFGVVELLKGGQHRQHAAMMVMAMLGFYFEVSRHDRDKFIRVHMRHVRPDKLHHFEKIREDATFPLPYDYKSATHPAWQFWRQLGKTSISTVATFKQMDPDGSIMKSLGQHHHLLSELDIVKINSVYGIECFMKNSGKSHSKKDKDVEEEEEVKEEKEKENSEEEISNREYEV